MRTPERWPTGGARRAAIIAGILLALLIVVVLIWTFVSTPPPGRRDAPSAVPIDPRQQRLRISDPGSRRPLVPVSRRGSDS